MMRRQAYLKSGRAGLRPRHKAGGFQGCRGGTGPTLCDRICGGAARSRALRERLGPKTAEVLAPGASWRFPEDKAPSDPNVAVSIWPFRNAPKIPRATEWAFFFRQSNDCESNRLYRFPVPNLRSGRILIRLSRYAERKYSLLRVCLNPGISPDFSNRPMLFLW